MKHLLTALIAALVLALPLHADNAPLHPTVRIVDHQGDPINDVSVRLYVRVDGTDPLLHAKRASEPGWLSIYETQTNQRGIAAFRFFNDLEINPESIVIVKVIARAERLALDYRSWVPNPKEVRDESREPFQRSHASHAFKPYYRIRGEALLEQTATIQAAEASVCVVHLPRAQPELPYRPPIIQVRDTASIPVDHRNRLHLVPFAKGKPVEIGMLRYATSRDASNNTLLCFLHRFEPDPESVSVELDTRALTHDPEFDATLRYRKSVMQLEHGYGAIVRSDGEFAVLTDLLSSRSEKQGEYRMQVPAGEYVIVRNAIPRNGIEHDHWHDGSVFDTLLRLRRGEDLPHLKRITIPEGGTVELSSEDFLDPPAEPEADETQPADPR